MPERVAAFAPRPQGVFQNIHNAFRCLGQDDLFTGDRVLLAQPDRRIALAVRVEPLVAVAKMVDQRYLLAALDLADETGIFERPSLCSIRQ